MSLELFVPAYVIGLLGAGHCLGMCGGISAALSFAIPNRSGFDKLLILLSYNAGRIASYVLIGAAAGLLGRALTPLFSELTPLPILRIAAAAMLVLMGFYVSGWWKVLVQLERVGARLWHYIQPLSRRLLPVKHPGTAFVVGGLWGWLPCGLVYSILAYALAQGSVGAAAWVMFAFGLGTLPAIMLGGMASEKIKTLLQMHSLRSIMGISLMLFGLWTLVFAFQHSGHQHAGHGAPASNAAPAHHHAH